MGCLYTPQRVFEGVLTGRNKTLKKWNKLVEKKVGVSKYSTSERYMNSQRDKAYRWIDRMEEDVRLDPLTVRAAKDIFHKLRCSFTRIHKLYPTLVCCLLIAYDRTQIREGDHTDKLDRSLKINNEHLTFRFGKTSKDKWVEFLEETQTFPRRR
mmetsp:Transcript_16253/g.21527  ORF Transcript_16253/g.21527 Transcript_16253/m.21527 type:complete len:154 (+) Transcript_16253:3-464(+)